MATMCRECLSYACRCEKRPEPVVVCNDTLDLFAATAARDEAIERAGQGAGEEWMEEALRVIRTIAETRAEFTTDRVWSLLPDAPPEPRALGAAMMQARSRGWIERTDRTIPSTRPQCHRRPVRVWASKITASKEAAA